MEPGDNKLHRILKVYSGEGDAEIREELGRTDSEAQGLAEEIRRIARKEIDPLQIPGMEALAKEEGRPEGDLPVGLDEAVLQRSRRSVWLPRRLRWVAALVLLALCGLTWAGWQFVRPHSLTDDRFDGSRLDSRTWRCERPRVKQENGYVRLTNRGYLSTQQQFSEPFELSFRWKFHDLGEQPLYFDHLTVALRSSGIPKPEYPFEVRDGIAIKFNAVNGTVQFVFPTDPKTHYSTKREAVRFVPDTWYDIRITDNGETITVYCTGPGLPEHNTRQPVLKAHCPGPYERHHIAFYNRELVAGIPHESFIDDFKVRNLE